MDPSNHRVRNLGVNVWHHPTGKRNLITDVSGLAVGHTTLIRGQSVSGVIDGIVRTGVTALTFPNRDPARPHPNRTASA